jgi:hypothetical protein
VGGRPPRHDRDGPDLLPLLRAPAVPQPLPRGPDRSPGPPGAHPRHRSARARPGCLRGVRDGRG